LLFRRHDFAKMLLVSLFAARRFKIACQLLPPLSYAMTSIFRLRHAHGRSPRSPIAVFRISALRRCFWRYASRFPRRRRRRQRPVSR